MLKGLMRRKRLGALAAVAAIAVAAGAYAYWTAPGSGSGSAGVGTNGSVTLSASVEAGIAPGTSKPVVFRATNATNSPIFVTTVHLAGVEVDSEHSDCETDDFTMSDVTEEQQVPASTTNHLLDDNGTLVYANTGVNQDACKGATLTLNLTSE